MSYIFSHREVDEFKKRYRWMALFVMVAFFLLLLRMTELQVFRATEFQEKATDNVTKTIPIRAMRGDIVDFTERIIATNRAAFKVYVTPSMIDLDADLVRVQRLLDLDEPQMARFQKKLQDIPARRRTQRIEVFADINRDQLAALETHAEELPGLDVVTVPVRTYPYATLGAHAIGFVNEVNSSDLERLSTENYRAGDHIGRIGVEQAWERYLRGTNGYEEIIVDVRGRDLDEGTSLRVRTKRKDQQPGHDVVLTIDMQLMQILERAFVDHPSGAAVIVDVQTGAVRALYSKPAYDLNEMSGKLTHERAQALDNDILRPRIDKTLYEIYQPGSTLKPMVALAGLMEGLIEGGSRVTCHGYYELGRDRKRCTRVHGEVDLRSALVQSCNVYFYRLAELLGLDRVYKYFTDFGFGAQTEIGINTEAKGFTPSKKWYVDHYQTPFRIGYTLNEAIGQGNTRVTLIQLAMAYAAVANGGILYQPRIVKEIRSKTDGRVVETFPAQERRRLNIPENFLEQVRVGMIGAVNDPKGTAYDARVPDGPTIAGKTGTAQVSKQASSQTLGLPNFQLDRDHAWFAGFAPAKQPQLAIVVLVEHGGGGGRFAAPIALKVLSEYLTDRY